MKQVQSSDSSNSYLRAVYFVVFLYAAWIGAWLLERALEPRITWINSSGGQVAYWTAMRLLLWILPSIVVIRLAGYRLSEVIAVDRWRAAILWGGGAGLIFAAFSLISHAVNHQPLFSPDLSWPFVSGVIIAPVVEEITFRGAVLKTLMLRQNFVLANTLTALFFLGSHLPGWYFQGRLSNMLTQFTGGAVSILIIGWVLGLVAYKSKSILGSLLTHILNNLFSLQ